MVSFVREGKSRGVQAQLNNIASWSRARDWKLVTDIGRQIQVPQIIET